MLTQPPSSVALSIKQPWAALVVAGLKTIEIRRWPTDYRGRLLIHASRMPDERPKVWRGVPGEIHSLTQRRGGIIGSVELVDCARYDNRNRFQADQHLHWNDPSWFKEPALYGFVFSHPEELCFRPHPGWFRFFQVETQMPVFILGQGKMSPSWCRFFLVETLNDSPLLDAT
jgi:hypothetical protein